LTIRSIRVACAVIEDDGRVLAAQRSEKMNMPLKWEFPGGKLHEGESAEECLAREIYEELGVRAVVGRPLPPVFHRYVDFDIELLPFVCTLEEGEMTLAEHRAIAWVAPCDLKELDWPEADLPVIESYLESLKGESKP
jgi:8-oxo-dGTP diphosphatase